MQKNVNLHKNLQSIYCAKNCVKNIVHNIKNKRKEIFRWPASARTPRRTIHSVGVSNVMSRLLAP